MLIVAPNVHSLPATAQLGVFVFHLGPVACDVHGGVMDLEGRLAAVPPIVESIRVSGRTLRSNYGSKNRKLTIIFHLGQKKNKNNCSTR